MFPKDIIFDTPSDIFEVVSVKREGDRAVLLVKSKQGSCFCPDCGHQSLKLHSYYLRTIKDLPAFGIKVTIRLQARKFYCHNTDCPKKVFTEQFPDHFTRYKRTSNRLREKLLKIALLTGGNVGERLCHALSMPVSSSTLIRLIHQQELPGPGSPVAVGIDDWAYKKGHYYGTAIVDLQSRRIIDLLPDREAITVENWLSKKTGIEVVTRDRYSRYAKGVTNGAPHAVQVADRWHLLKNMGEAIQKLLERNRQEIKRLSVLKPSIGVNEMVKTNTPEKKPTVKRPSHREHQFHQAKQLYAAGATLRSIARALKISRITIRKYIHLDEPPRKGGARTNILMFAEYLQSRIQENPRVETLQLWKEIKDKGYNGGRSAVYEYLKPHTQSRNNTPLPILPQISWVPSKVSLLLYTGVS